MSDTGPRNELHPGNRAVCAVLALAVVAFLVSRPDIRGSDEDAPIDSDPVAAQVELPPVVPAVLEKVVSKCTRIGEGGVAEEYDCDEDGDGDLHSVVAATRANIAP